MKRAAILRRSPLVRSGRLQRTPIAAMSTKRKAANKERRANVHAAFGDHPTCYVCHTAPAQDAHELLSRARGGSITNPDGMIPVCRACHSKITESPAWAESQGWALPSPPRRVLSVINQPEED